MPHSDHLLHIDSFNSHLLLPTTLQWNLTSAHVTPFIASETFYSFVHSLCTVDIRSRELDFLPFCTNPSRRLLTQFINKPLIPEDVSAMGNCQAAEAETVVIMHPGSKIERIYWPVSARHVMNSNPGHYVAAVVTSQGARSENGLPVKQLKLLRPDDSLVTGKVYRLICFEDILKEFAAKKCVKLGKLLKERGVLVLETKGLAGAPTKESNVSSLKHGGNRSRNRSRVRGRKHHQHQWKPALKSISENEN